MKLPVSSQSMLPSLPRPKTKIGINAYIKSKTLSKHITPKEAPKLPMPQRKTPKLTEKEERAELLKAIRPKNEGRVTMDEFIINSWKVKEFENKWKPKKKEQNLQEALFDVYVERNIKTKKI